MSREHLPTPPGGHGHHPPQVDLSTLFEKKNGAAGQPDAVDGLRYTCSCHPEIIQNAPGDCPLCGMSLVPLGPALEGDGDRDLKVRLAWGSFAGLGVVIPAMAPMVMPGGFGWMVGGPWPYIQGLLATAVVFGAGWPLLRRFASSVRLRAFNMFTLTGVGTLTAWGFSVLALLFPSFIPKGFAHHGTPLYFESATVITLLVLLGQVIEGQARRKSNDGLKALWEALPQWALVRRGKDLVRLSAGAVRRGDTVVVATGEAIPVDGTVLAGQSQVIEAVLTGEAFPVDVNPGAWVRAGGKNMNGSLEIRAEAAGKDCLLGKVAAEVTRARQSKTPAQGLADRVSKVFIPVVFLWALVTAGIWAFVGPEPRWVWVAMTAMSVLLVACPCALGLAIPMSVATAVARGARSGVLVRDAGGLWALSETDTIVFDKTGTLTRGEPRVVAVIPLSSSLTEEKVIGWAASAESLSHHPMAGALVDFAKNRGIPLLPVTRFLETAGGGIRAQIEGREITVGQKTFLHEQGVTGWDEHPSHPSHPALTDHHGKTYVAVDGQWAGMILFEDPLKDGVAELLGRLKKRGLRLILLSGDRVEAVAAMAKDLPFDEVHGGQTPLGKGQAVAKWQGEGRKVLFAGDGLNDLAALESAHGSVAMGLAASLKSAPVLLPGGDLKSLERALDLSRALRTNSRVNLGLAFGYNLLALPLASGILVPFTGWVLTPMVAAALMAVSSLSVVLSALTLLRARLGE